MRAKRSWIIRAGRPREVGLTFTDPCGRGSHQTPVAPPLAGYKSVTRHATPPGNSDLRMWSLEDGRGIAASQCPAGTPLPNQRREPTRCSSGPGNHPGKRFPAHLSATPDNCLGWSPSSVSRVRDTAARRFLRRYRSLRRHSQRTRPYTRSTGRLAKSGREQSSPRSGPKIGVLSAHRPAETRTPSYPTRRD